MAVDEFWGNGCGWEKGGGQAISTTKGGGGGALTQAWTHLGLGGSWEEGVQDSGL